MKNNKIIILTLAIIAVLAQGTCAYAKSSTDDGYTKDELNNSEPGFEWEDIDKNNQKVSSYINSYSSEKTPQQVAEESDTTDSTSTATASTSSGTVESNTGNIIVGTSPSTGAKGDYWGKTASGKWILLEKGVPASGWKQVKGTWYYMDADGIMQTGWINDGANWYYLNSGGGMAHNTYIGNYYLDGNGVMQ